MKSSSAVTVSAENGGDDVKSRRTVHGIMTLSMKFHFIVQKVVIVLKDNEDSGFKELFD